MPGACPLSATSGSQPHSRESLGYRTLYVWFADEDLMITVQTNSQPPDGTAKLYEAVTALYKIVRKAKAE